MGSACERQRADALHGAHDRRRGRQPDGADLLPGSVAGEPSGPRPGEVEHDELPVACADGEHVAFERQGGHLTPTPRAGDFGDLGPGPVEQDDPYGSGLGPGDGDSPAARRQGLEIGGQGLRSRLVRGDIPRRGFAVEIKRDGRRVPSSMKASQNIPRPSGRRSRDREGPEIGQGQPRICPAVSLLAKPSAIAAQRQLRHPHAVLGQGAEQDGVIDPPDLDGRIHAC